LAEGLKNPKDAAGSDTGQKGAQRDEILRLRRYADEVEDEFGTGSPEHVEAKEALELTEQLYGVTEDLKSKGVMDSTTMVRAQWDEILSDHTDNGPGGDKKVDWDSFNEMYGLEGEAAVTNAVEFGKWFRKQIVKSINSPISAEMLSELGTRAEYEAVVRAEYPKASAEDIRDTVDAAEGIKWQF
jgi:hypothetical protein